LVFDSHLNFESHIAECTRNCFFRLKLLYKIQNYLSQELRVVLCESLILSKLNYCDTVYGPCLLSRTAKLVQRVQNACARYCFNVPPRSNVTPFLDAANMLKMEDRRQLHLASLLIGIIEGHRPLYLFNKLVWAKDFKRYPKRACTQIFVTLKHRTAAFRGSFRYASTKCWNNIPPPIRNLQTLSSFKSSLKTFLLKEQKSQSHPGYT
jgi:hypothetical protein